MPRPSRSSPGRAPHGKGAWAAPGGAGIALLALMLLAAVPAGLAPSRPDARREALQLAGTRTLEEDLVRAVGRAGTFLDSVARSASFDPESAARDGHSPRGPAADSGSDLVGGLRIGTPIAPPAPRVEPAVERPSRQGLRAALASFQPLFDLTRTLELEADVDGEVRRGELSIVGEPSPSADAIEPLPARPGLLGRDLRLDPALFAGGYGEVGKPDTILPDATPDLGSERMRVPLLGGTSWSLGLRKLHADDRYGWVEESTSRGSDEELYAVFTLTLRF